MPKDPEVYSSEQRELLQQYWLTVEASFTMLHKMGYSSDPATILRVLGITTPVAEVLTSVVPLFSERPEPASSEAVVEPPQQADSSLVGQARQNIYDALQGSNS